MEYKEEQHNKAGEKVLEERNPEREYSINVLSHVLKQIFMRGVAVYLFYNVFVILVQRLKGSVQEYVNDGKCPLDEK